MKTKVTEEITRRPTKVRNWLNAKPSRGHEPKGDSMTVPDQAMSLEQIIRNHTRGIPMDVKMREYYDDAEDALGIDIRTLDLAEIESMRREMEYTISRHEAGAAIYAEKQKEEEIEKRAQAKMAKYRSEMAERMKKSEDDEQSTKSP